MSKITIENNRWNKFFLLHNNRNTIQSYSRYLTIYFQHLYGEYADPKKKAEEYFATGRDYEFDVSSFFNSIASTRAPITYRSIVSVIKAFHEYNDVELKNVFWKRINKLCTRRGVLTEDRPPTHKELRSIIQHQPIHGKALYLIMASSGIRIGEALHLMPGDIDLASSPVKITIRADYTKTKMKRITFMSNEAKEALQDWLKLREGYILTAKARSNIYAKEVNDGRLFPFTETVAREMWGRALKKSGLNIRDPQTGVHIIHPHCLRKFFRTKHKAEVDIKEALMGHEGYLTGSYRRYDEEELASAYKQGMGGVNVFSSSEEMEDLRGQVEEQKKQIADLNEQSKSLSVIVQEMFKKDPRAMEKMVRFFDWWNEAFVGTIPTNQLPTVAQLTEITGAEWR